MADLIELLRKRAADHGGDKLLEEAAAALEAAREDAWQGVPPPRNGHYMGPRPAGASQSVESER